jgi:hypothetical protein
LDGRAKPKRASGLPVHRTDVHVRPSKTLWREVQIHAEKSGTSLNETIDTLLRSGLHPFVDDTTLLAKRLDKIEARFEGWHDAVSEIVRKQLLDTHRRFQMIETRLTEMQSQLRIFAQAVQADHQKYEATLARIVTELLPKSQRAMVQLLREIIEGIATKNPRVVRSWVREHLT